MTEKLLAGIIATLLNPKDWISPGTSQIDVIVNEICNFSNMVTFYPCRAFYKAQLFLSLKTIGRCLLITFAYSLDPDQEM